MCVKQPNPTSSNISDSQTKDPKILLTYDHISHQKIHACVIRKNNNYNLRDLVII